MGLYRKKPVVIEAVQFPGVEIENIDAVVAFDDWMVSVQGVQRCKYRGNTVVIATLEGEMTASAGDWIIRGVKGELYPCKPDIFAESYEAADFETSVAENTIPSSPFKLADPDDMTLARVDTVGDLSHNLGTFAGVQPYTRPDDPRVQQLLDDAERNREAEARTGDEPRQIFTDPRLDKNWRAPKTPRRPQQ